MDKKQIILDLLESLIREMDSADIRPLMEKDEEPMVVVKEEKIDTMPLEGSEDILKDKIAGALEEGASDEPMEEDDEEEDKLKKLRERLS